MFGRKGHDRPAPGDPIGGWCEHCGAAYAVAASQCPECHAPVVVSNVVAWSTPEPVNATTFEAEPARPPDAERHDIVEYDLKDWDAHQRRELTRQLDLDHIVHEWRGRVLRVPGAHETEVDALVDTLDATFPEDADVLDYEMPEWTMGQCDELVRRMDGLGLVYEWDGLTLTVPSSAEATVDAVVRAIDPGFPT